MNLQRELIQYHQRLAESHWNRAVEYVAMGTEKSAADDDSAWCLAMARVCRNQAMAECGMAHTLACGGE